MKYRNKNIQTPQTGFSLIEILVVMVIMASIMGLVANNIGKNKIKAKIQQTKIQIGQLQNAAESFSIDTGYYPKNLNELVEDNGDSNWLGPYIKKKELRDPWGEEFKFNNPGQNDEEFSITSYGNDRSQGGSKLDKDINSWD